ncbi:probable E3 SUMO-protein ligase RNF212 isoform X2 [Physella acuta]|uniref:probable E3 SUMO-protein ligase RNF212 isoform X2 n=1 Tax=Physella acuta TaxID=109671 RepID=UPI0027DC7689|nr:probable E3 SUMO-protein ligase RNF212 isoform X2 [Physella acuta]
MVVVPTPDLSSLSLVNKFSDAENMSHWMHCNGCYCQPEPGVELRFFLTNCSHIYCEKCVSACTKEKCKVCRSQCNTLLLGGKIQKEVENLFADPIDLHQKFTKQFYQTLEFQKSHQRRLVRQLREKLKILGSQINEVKNVIAQAQTIERESMKLKSENEYLKLLLSKRDSHPRSKSGASPVAFSASPNRSPFGSTHFGSSNSRNYGISSNILNQPGRLLMRTPPSGGHAGTVGGMHFTPTGLDRKGSSITPLSIPRPIVFPKDA